MTTTMAERYRAAMQAGRVADAPQWTARERADAEWLEHQLKQHREIVAGLEARMAESRMAIDELCLMAQQAEVAA